MESIKHFVVRSLLGVPSTIVSLGVVGAIHEWGYHPEILVQELLLGVPAILSAKLAGWILVFIVSVAIWAVADSVVYRRHAPRIASKRMILWIGMFAGCALVAVCGSLLYFERNPSKKPASHKNLVWVFSGMAGTNDADGFRVSDVQFWTPKNETGRAIRLLDAYIQSGIDTGKRLPLLLNTHQHGLISLRDANPIPANTENITLIAEFPRLYEREFMKDWGIITFVIQDEDQTFRGTIDEKALSEIFAGYRPKPPQPRVTRADPPRESEGVIKAKLQILQTFFECLDKDAVSVYKMGTDFWGRWNGPANAGSPQGFLDFVVGFHAKVIAVHEKLESIAIDNQRYPDVTQSHQFWYNVQIHAADNLLKDELKRIIQLHPGDNRAVLLLNNRFVDEWYAALNNYSNWIREKKQFISNKQKALEAM